MAKRLLLPAIYAFLFCFSCTREVSVQLSGPVVEDGQISGRVILPPNTKADTAGLVVLSSTGFDCWKVVTCPRNRGYGGNSL